MIDDRFDRRLIGDSQFAAESVRQQLTGEVLEEQVFFLTQGSSQAIDSGDFGAVGQL